MAMGRARPSALMILAAIVTAVYGVAVLAIGVLGVSRDAVTGAPFLVVGAVTVAAAIGIARARPWARLAGVLLALVGLAFAVFVAWFTLALAIPEQFDAGPMLVQDLGVASGPLVVLAVLVAAWRPRESPV